MNKIYPDMNEKEKIFGGVFTMGEFAWIASGVLLGVVIAISLYQIIGGVAVIFGLPFPVLGGFMAFYKKYDMSLARYLFLKRKHIKRNKEFPNRRQRKVFRVSPYLYDEHSI